MKIYRVLVRRPMFSGCGNLQAENVTFRSKAIATKFAKKKCQEHQGKTYLIRVEEFILKKLEIDNLLIAFDNEDIMDLIEQRSIVKDYVQQVSS